RGLISRVLSQRSRIVSKNFFQRNWPNKQIVLICQVVICRDRNVCCIETYACDGSGSSFGGNAGHSSFARQPVNVWKSSTFSQQLNSSLIDDGIDQCIRSSKSCCCIGRNRSRKRSVSH